MWVDLCAVQFLIGSMKVYESAEQRDAPSSYNGPVFEDLDQVRFTSDLRLVVPETFLLMVDKINE